MTVFPLTSHPDVVFAPGKTLTMVDLAGAAIGPPLVVERGKAYHREWLLKFVGVDDRSLFDNVRDVLLTAPAASLAPPAENEAYLHELTGFAVQLEDGTGIGLVSGLYEPPAGLMLEVQGPKREFLLPFKKEFIRRVDRIGRRLVVTIPDGLLD